MPASGVPPALPVLSASGVSSGSGASEAPLDVPALLTHLREEAAAAGAELTVRSVPARSEVGGAWPSWVPEDILAALSDRGAAWPWRHQALAADLAHGGHDVVVATGTGSGKSLAYLVPVLSALHRDPRATALYLAPTKALAHGQSRVVVEAFDRLRVRSAVLDGDTPLSMRDWTRAHGQLVFSNPDMLHASLLPSHTRWTRFLRRLTYLVVDECHHYRGVFGSRTALVLRRLLRIARELGADPTVVLASATVADPGTSAEALTGRPTLAVQDDGSPRGEVHLAVWVPADGVGAPTDTARLLTRLVASDARTLAFVQSRRAAEVVALTAREALARLGDARSHRLAPYRAGLLPEQRRRVEADLLSGRLLGVASTNALELGIDVSGLDAVLMAGFPGTMSSLRQQMGRAGRGGREALAVLVARGDPLDRYLARHPEHLLDRPVERIVIDPSNPHVLGPQLEAAVAELPWRAADEGTFADGTAESGSLATLAATGAVRRRPSGWYHTGRPRTRPGLRDGDADRVTIVEASTGQVLGTVERHAACRTVHRDAVYLHAGETYRVSDLSLDEGLALVIAGDPGWTTQPRTVSTVTVSDIARTRSSGPVDLVLGSVRVTSTVVSFIRRSSKDGSVLDERPLELLPSELTTTAVWYALSPDLPESLGIGTGILAGALHAAEHAAIGMLPLIASCDRWDVGGLSTELHPDTGRPTVFVHDGHPGGAGIAARGFEAAARWLATTAQVVADCGCSSGCPSCVQSPKCGNANYPLDRPGAVAVLRAVSAALGSD